MRRLVVMMLGIVPTAIALARRRRERSCRPSTGITRSTSLACRPPTGELQSICIQPNGTRAQASTTDETIQTPGCTVLVTASTPSLAPARRSW